MFFFIPFAYVCIILIFVSTADDPKSGQYSEDEGWQFITLGDQVGFNFEGKYNNAKNASRICFSLFELKYIYFSVFEFVFHVIFHVFLCARQKYSHSLLALQA